MSKFDNVLFENRLFDSHSEEGNMQYRNENIGDISQYDMPFGGFPPLYLCSEQQTGKSTNKKKFSIHKAAVSIKDIMRKRKDIKGLKLE